MSTAESSGVADPVPVPEAILRAARAAERVVVISGAGMSAESGVPTFRDAQTGLWERFRPEDLATVDAWQRDRDFVWAWYVWRFGRVHEVEPNAGHRAVADLAKHATTVQVVTQNVDDLHERAGSDDVVHLHGSLAGYRCAECERPYDQPVVPPDEPQERLTPPTCPDCGAWIRPGVVWFGEMLPRQEWDRAVQLIELADLVLVVGTSGIVYPAAGLPALARSQGATVVEINPDETELSSIVHQVWRASAATALPALVRALQD